MCRQLIVLDHRLCRVDDFGEIVRRDARHHTDRDTVGAIYEQVRDAHREHGRLFLGLIEVRSEIDDILVEIREKCFLCHLLQPGLGISHCRRPVSLNGAEVAVSVHERHTLFEFLCHHNECLVDGRIAVRMVFTHRIADDSRTFPVWPVVTDAELIHIVQCAPLYRLQAVPHIRQRTGDDDAHRVINVRLLHDVRVFGSDDLFLIIHWECSFLFIMLFIMRTFRAQATDPFALQTIRCFAAPV